MKIEKKEYQAPFSLLLLSLTEGGILEPSFDTSDGDGGNGNESFGDGDPFEEFGW